MTARKIIAWIFSFFVFLSLLAPLWVSQDLLFPFVTTKAFYFRILIELALPFYLFLVVSGKSLRPNLKNPVTISILAFWALNLLSAFFGVNTFRSLWGNFERMGGVYYMAHLTLLYFFVLMLGQLGGKYLKSFLWAIITVALIVGVNGIFGKLGWPTLVSDPSLPYRASSTLGNPIYLGSFLIIPMFLTVFFGLQAESLKRKIFYYFLAFLQLTGIFISGTRGAVVGLFAGLFLAALAYLFLTTSQKTRAYGFAAVGVLVLLGGVLFTQSDKLPQGSMIQRVFKLKDSNTEARLIQWKVALQGFKDYPVFGTGPENYYIISNLHFNPEIYKYDRSWFDKPHNFLLEILVTSGAQGFLAYLAAVIFAVWAFYKAYKAGFCSLLEFCMLLSAMLVYQIQNLTVFDNVSASLVFYSFLGFAAYLWDESKEQAKEKDKPSKRQNNSFGFTVLGVSSVVALYLVFITNVDPMKAAKYTNYGYAYGARSIVTARDFFEKAKDSPFNIDPGEAATKYAEAAGQAVQNPAEKNKDIAKQSLDSSIDYLEKLTQSQPNYAPYWLSLANAYLTRGAVFEKRIDPMSVEAVNKELELAPNRIEGRTYLARIRLLQGNYPDAIRLLEELNQQFPDSMDTKSLLARSYMANKQIDKAVPLMQQAIDQGYAWSSLPDVQWLADYYIKANRPQDAIKIYEKDIKIETNNILPYRELAKLYAQVGDKTQAVKFANFVIQADPEHKQEMESLLKSLQ